MAMHVRRAVSFQTPEKLSIHLNCPVPMEGGTPSSSLPLLLPAYQGRGSSYITYKSNGHTFLQMFSFNDYISFENFYLVIIVVLCSSLFLLLEYNISLHLS